MSIRPFLPLGLVVGSSVATSPQHFYANPPEPFYGILFLERGVWALLISGSSDTQLFLPRSYNCLNL